MKITPFKVLFSVGALVFVGLAVRGCTPTANPYLLDLGIAVPNSAVLSHQNYPSLMGDEDLLVLQVPPSQVPSLMAQFKKKRDYDSAPFATSINGLAPTKQFFARVPRQSLVGTFRVDHKESSPAWPTFCSFAIDPSTGKV
ncbi:hypothetical protein IAD21_02099 [Abditibacteriota bacterium]|nr:hypothetical protein IAD21_02099 [Abditibacteriota bacterium]